MVEGPQTADQSYLRRGIEYLYGSKCLPSFVRMDRGTETGKLATMHAYLRRKNSDIQNDEEACGTVLLYIHVFFFYKNKVYKNACLRTS